MDTAEEPQKKIFKARKTMKASDRQQLDAVHKAKEDLLKLPELKLVNGNHENGDSDMNFIHNATDPMEDKRNLNGININSDSHDSIVKLSDIKEGLINIDQTSDLKLPLDFELPESITCPEDTSKIGTSSAVTQACLTNSEKQLDEKVTGLEKVDQREQEGLSLVEDLSCDTELSGEKILSITHEEAESHNVLEGVHKLEDVNPVEDAIERDLEHEDMDTFLESPIAKAENETEDHILKEPLDAEAVDYDNIVENDETLNKEEPQNESDCTKLQENEMQNVENVEENIGKQENLELVNGPHEPNILSDMAVSETGYSEEKREASETLSPQQDVGEEAISSSMEVDQNLKIEGQKSSPAEAPFDLSVSDMQRVSGMESLDTMETDEIIPILEKLAPVEDALEYFSKTGVLSESATTEEEKTENNSTSPSKNDSGEILPSEAFLVLSDEEELCGESIPPKENLLNDQDAAKVITEEPEEKDKEQGKTENVDEPQAEKSEISRRKRSKSEDLDSQSSKRRRFEGEEYEAELQVKITAGDDLNKKLQKVIQKMFEEKLSALQCIDFDKAIADLKTRVEKIECKKHETVLHSMQAKITRLTKRFGAAKEDLKKRPEQTTVTQPASPEKSAVGDPAQSTSSMTYRTAGTVRQMLESKRSVGETTTANVLSSTAASTSVPSPSNLTLRTSNTSQMTVNQPPVNTTLQTRAPPDWKLIQQKINASSIGASQNTLSSQSKPVPPVTSAPIMTSVLPAPSTATVVGNSQVSTSSTQPTLPSLPFILHVPVAMPSQPQLLQGTTGTLVTNKQSGNVEFIPVQNQTTVGSLTKTPVSLPVTKAINSPSMPSPGIQRNSPGSSIASTLTVQAIPTTHSVTLSSRPSLPTVGTSGIYSQASNRNTAQLKTPVSAFNITSSTESSSGSRPELQTSRTQTAETGAGKRAAESSASGGKAAAGVIDLTLDDEDAELSLQDSRRTNSAAVSGNVQTSQPVARQAQAPQPALPSQPLQTSAPAGLPSQATIHVLPTAQTTVNITQRPGTQIATRASAPRAPNNPHMVYTSTLPTVPVQTPIRHTTMQSQNLRQISPQTGGVPVRMPQTTAYVVNNGMPVSSTGPQLTVHHRPPQEPARPIHPAPLPEAPQPQRLPPEAASTSAPQKPHLKLARVQSQNGIVLSWSVLEVDRSCAVVDSYHLYAYHEDPTATSPSQWKKIGEVKALPLPMACTLTQFVSGSKYYFAVRAKDVYGRFGPFCDPQSTDVISTQSS
ncbi:activating transcription factor 7-interacting protein 1 [Mixophyes fleayi]|uniref:activating transcription factor 7-interacting protein 1 n=1 Tax=Mixophyes fleayi TaxID=3061075 RepID=UPI003F4DBAB6